MARARNIKPAFFQNELLAELDPLTRLAFIGLWTIADFNGCIEFRPKRLKVQILPYDECNFESIVNNLDNSGFISTYSVLGQLYIKIINFTKHQSPHKNEREAGSIIPDYDKDDSKINELTQDGTTPDKNGTTRAESLFLNPSSLIPDPLLLKPDISTTPAPEKPARFDPRDLAMPIGLKSAKWDEWVSYRSKVGKKPKAETWSKQLEFIAQCIAKGYDPGLMIDESIRNGWQGIFSPKQGHAPADRAKQQRDATIAYFEAKQNVIEGDWINERKSATSL